ncbi:TPA: hypothetical protein ACOENG_004399 [Stenotrophomonas maltophilia]|uniref:hypothetical protein n=2 Tax=Stenotrophomonas maltophilia TaxID=40324 RepID=UPI00117BFC7E|nr:hypothetical protein [Stenotrophomonas maltophilia]HDS1307950.1 hypothetical protein [Stenotrophomonas maltophilia]HDS1312489.1 hypothetical protein [Stenotrophomonas maltophilia]HDS1317219.1 hypothetical protein [Stenotrophomonas maltophilia]HDS1442105.1 hypothetical protein [Stenotrophomonas maltophilia]HDS1516894.1 hypothetical protein [Stenotrophomonas maltophilia]
MTMMERSKTNAGRVRALFERQPSAALMAREIYQGVGATTPIDRDRIRSALRDLTEANYLLKDGTGQRALFRLSGIGMPRAFVVTDEQRERCRLDKAHKQALRRAARRGGTAGARTADKMTINRARVERLSGLAPAKAWGKEKDGQRPAETVEQFQARGGQVQRLTASWEQRA